MLLTVLGSCSKGNGYILHNDTEALIIELGVNFEHYKRALNFKIDKVVGCLVTHEHGDHSKSVKKAIDANLTVVMSRGTQTALKVDSHRIKNIGHMKKIVLGGFTVFGFNVVHDVAEPLGFMIQHEETGRICFITDSMFIDYTFPGINNFIVEANYCDRIIEENVAKGILNARRADRTKYSHMSLRTCHQFLSANDLSEVNNIVLIHLSDKNSDEVIFKEEIEGLTGKKVTIAKKGVEIEFNKTPF